MVKRYKKRDPRWKRLIEAPPLWALDLPGLLRFQDPDGRIWFRTAGEYRRLRAHMARAGRAVAAGTQKKYRQKRALARKRKDALAGTRRRLLRMERDWADPIGSNANDRAVIAAMSAEWLAPIEIASRVVLPPRPARAKRYRWPIATHPVGTVIYKRLLPRALAERHPEGGRYRLTDEGLGTAARLAAGEVPVRRRVVRSVGVAVGGLPADRFTLSLLSVEAWRAVVEMCELVGVPKAQARKSLEGSTLRNTLCNRLVPQGYVEQAISEDYKYRLKPRNYYRLTELGAFLRAELEDLVG